MSNTTSTSTSSISTFKEYYWKYGSYGQHESGAIILVLKDNILINSDDAIAKGILKEIDRDREYGRGYERTLQLVNTEEVIAVIYLKCSASSRKHYNDYKIYKLTNVDIEIKYKDGTYNWIIVNGRRADYKRCLRGGVELNNEGNSCEIQMTICENRMKLYGNTFQYREHIKRLAKRYLFDIEWDEGDKAWYLWGDEVDLVKAYNELVQITQS